MSAHPHPLDTPPITRLVHIVDGGCTTLRGLADRCNLFKEIYGPGAIFNHEEGFVYDAEDGTRILVQLTTNPTVSYDRS